MRTEATEMIWFEQHVLTFEELGELSGLPRSLLSELLDCGAIAPLAVAGGEVRFGAEALGAARAARRLRADFELDLQALVLALSLLDRVADLETQLRELRARMPRQPG